MRVVTWNIHGGRDASVRAIAAELRSLEADVACLNEVRRKDARTLASSTGMRAFSAASAIGPYGNVILTSQQVSGWRRFAFSHTRRVERRDAAIVVLAGGITIASLHLNLQAPKRLAEAAELLRVLPDRGIVAGDLNESEGGSVWRAFASRFVDACAGDPRSTFPAQAPRARIDFIWVPRDARVVACDVVATRSSDHLPVVVDVHPG